MRAVTNPIAHGCLELPGSVETGLTNPGVRGKLKKDVVSIFGKASAGEKAIIQLLSMQVDEKGKRSYHYSFTTFTEKKGGLQSYLPESARDIVLGKTHHIKTENPEDIFSYNDEYYRRTDEPLFPKSTSPSLDEIRQGSIPDCSFLAAIQAILAHPNGAAFIRSMMRQNADGTTTVRLFHPVEKRFVFVCVENSILNDQLGQLSGHSAFWVHCLEKAYAVLGVNEDRKNEINMSSGVAFNDGVSPSFVLQVLTGLDAKSIDLPKVVYGEKKRNMKTYFENERIKEMVEKTKLTAPDFDLSPEQLRTNIEKILWDHLPDYAGIQEAEIFGVFPELNEADATALVKELLYYMHENPNKFEILITDGKFEELSSEESRILSTHLRLEQVFSSETSKTFTGNYTKREVKFFQDLKQSLSEGVLVAAGTDAKIEGSVVGLPGNHAYTVLAVGDAGIPIKDKNDETKTVPVCYVKLRNPWGSTGRNYLQNLKTLEIHPEKTESGIFYLELTEFLKYFDKIYQTESSATSKFEDQAKKEKLIVKIYELLGQWRIGGENTLMDIAGANLRADIIEEKISELESLGENYPHLRELLDQQKNILAILISSEANKFAEQLDKLKELASHLSDNIHAHLSFECSDSREKVLNDYLQAVCEFDDLVFMHAFLQNKASSSQINSSLVGSKEILEKISRDIAKCRTHIQEHIGNNPDAQQLFDSTLAVRREIQAQANQLNVKRELSDVERFRVNAALQSPRGKKLSGLAEQYQQSQNPELKNLGEKISTFRKGWKKLCEFFRVVCHKARTFFFSGSYEVDDTSKNKEKIVGAIVPPAERH